MKGGNSSIIHTNFHLHFSHSESSLRRVSVRWNTEGVLSVLRYIHGHSLNVMPDNFLLLLEVMEPETLANSYFKAICICCFMTLIAFFVLSIPMSPFHIIKQFIIKHMKLFHSSINIIMQGFTFL